MWLQIPEYLMAGTALHKQIPRWGSYLREFLGGYGCTISQRKHGLKYLSAHYQFSAHCIFNYSFQSLNMQRVSRWVHCSDASLCATSRVMEATVQQSPWCYRRICVIRGTQSHTEHVFLSSSRLYALRACHFRGSILLWTLCLGHKPLAWSESWNRFQPC